MSSLPSQPLFKPSSGEDVREIECEIELPSGQNWTIPMFIRNRYSQLDNLEHIDITSHGLIMVIRPCLETSYWTCYYSWKFCILLISNREPMDVCIYAPWRRRGIAQWPFLTMRILILGRLPIPCCQLHSCLTGSDSLPRVYHVRFRRYPSLS
jgi:hypothetical protein